MNFTLRNFSFPTCNKISGAAAISMVRFVSEIFSLFTLTPPWAINLRASAFEEERFVVTNRSTIFIEASVRLISVVIKKSVNTARIGGVRLKRG